MSVKYDPKTRVTTYTQRIGAMEYGPWTGERMLFMREFSFTTDVGNGLAPARVALPAANLRIAMQEFASGFFSSGGQPMTLLTVAGNPSPGEIDRTERFFQRTVAIPGWAQEMCEHPDGRSHPTDAFAKVPQLYRAVKIGRASCRERV